MNDHIFSKRHTSIAKGIAILCMLFHHSVQNICYLPFWKIDGISLITIIASSCKVCVPLFTILSGYGLAVSYQKTEEVGVKFTISHLLQLYSIIWFINLPLCLGGLLKHMVQHEISVDILLRFMLAFLGINGFVGDWYFKAITILYCLFPFLQFAILKQRKLVVLMFIPQIVLFLLNNLFGLHIVLDNFLFYLGAFCLGIYLSYYKTLGSVKHPIKQGVILVVFGLLFRQIFTLIVDWIVALGIVILVSSIKNTENEFKLIVSLGQESSNIWLMHPILLSILHNYIPKETSWNIVVFFILTLACYILSKAVSLVKNFSGYNTIIRKLRLTVQKERKMYG